jgi:hypothetical protein
MTDGITPPEKNPFRLLMGGQSALGLPLAVAALELLE